MKKTFYLIFLLSQFIFFGQENKAKKPEYIYIANNEIINLQKIEEYAQNGYLKGMNKGVSEEERNLLAAKFGDKIGDKEFIIKISLFTENERNENLKKKNITPTLDKNNNSEDNGYILKVNDKAKDFTVKLINNNNISLSDLKGKVVLVNFWSTTCAPCLMEFYDIPNKIIEPFKNKDFAFLAISIGEDKETVLKKVTKLNKDGINLNFGIDTDKKIWNAYAKKSIPKNFLIDQNGIIRYTSTGNTEGNLDKIASEIKKLLSL